MEPPQGSLRLLLVRTFCGHSPAVSSFLSNRTGSILPSRTALRPIRADFLPDGTLAAKISRCNARTTPRSQFSHGNAQNSGLLSFPDNSSHGPPDPQAEADASDWFSHRENEMKRAAEHERLREEIAQRYYETGTFFKSEDGVDESTSHMCRTSHSRSAYPILIIEI